jgi:hypothetical protein
MASRQIILPESTMSIASELVAAQILEGLVDVFVSLAHRKHKR